MLFNSFPFLCAFLPVTLAGYFCLGRFRAVWAAAWLAGASLFFYAWWDCRYLALLLASILMNYYCAGRLAAAPQSSKKRWLAAAVGANLLLLGYYKYANFFLASAATLAGKPYPLLDIVLPVGISFFTFTQIAFLVDTAQGRVQEYRLLHYMLFVTYFPHLIAGPVLHHREMMPQFEDAANVRLSAENVAVGLSMFILGLTKKVLLADSLAPYAGAVFDNPDGPSLLLAWGGVLAYAFQLYFDFSGYSDMAVGLSRLFGIHLPLNFDSPYQAADIAEFWRRWHMTLSRFLRDYLYIPMGGKRRGPVRRYRNLMLTMVLGGLWHGAGWNFAIWGGLHGLFLIVHQGWSAAALHFNCGGGGRGRRAAAVMLTFLSVCCAWVFFRAPDLASALRMLKGMGGACGIALPDILGKRLGALQPLLEQAGIGFFLGGGGRFIATWSWVGAAALIVFCLPNTQQIVCRSPPQRSRLRWTPSPSWAVALGLLAVAGLLSLTNPSEFLYFQF